MIRHSKTLVEDLKATVKIKKHYKFEIYLLLDSNNLRRNITNIRISTHNLPIEAKRKYGLKREERICPLCNSNKIGTEIHSLFECTNPEIVEH